MIYADDYWPIDIATLKLSTHRMERCRRFKNSTGRQNWSLYSWL